MSKFVRYTCNKKNEPTMREDCMKCPEYNPCDENGQWCFVGALYAEYENTKACNDMTMPISADMTVPVMRDTSTMTIHFGESQSVDLLKEDFKKSINDSISKTLKIPRYLL